MSDKLKTSLVLTADGNQLKAELKSDAAAVKALGDTAKAASTDLNKAAAQIDVVTASAAKATAQTVKAAAGAEQLAAGAESAATAGTKAATAVKTVGTNAANTAAQNAKLNQTLGQQNLALNQVVASAQRASTGFLNLNRAGQAELRAAAVNSVQALAAGISPMMVLQTEGAQVLGALVQGGAVTMSTMVGVGAAIGGVVLAVGGLATAYAAGAAQTNAFNIANRMTAGAAGLTRDAIDQMASSANAAGKITAGTARSIATQMAASGKISSDVIGKLVGVTADFAAATGQSSTAAAAALQKLFADPIKGAKELDDQLNILSAADRQHIQDLAATGDQVGAQQALLDALRPRIQGASDDVGLLAKLWNGAAEAAGYYINAVQNIGRGPSPADQVKEAQDQLDSAKQKLAADKSLGFNTGPAERAVSDAEAKLNRSASGQDVDARTAALRAQEAALQDLGKTFDDYNKSQGSTAEKQKTLDDQIAKATDAIDNYQKALLAAAMIEKSGSPAVAVLKAGLDSATTAAENARNALAALRSPAQEALDSLGIANQVAGTSPRDRPATEAFLTTQDQARHSANPDIRNNADLIAGVARQKAIIAQTTAINDQNTAIDLNTKLTIAEGDAWKVSAAEGAAADAARLAAVKALSAPIDATADKMRQLAAAAADAYNKGAQQLQQLTQQADQQEALADSALQGASQRHQAELNQKIGDATKSLRDALANAADPQVAAGLRDEIAGITDQVIRLDDAANKFQLGDALQGQGDQIALLQKQFSLINATDGARAGGLAQAQAEIELAHMHVGALTDEGKQYLANADNIAKMNVQLDRQHAIAAELPNFFDQMFDRIGSGLTDLALQTGTLSQGIKNLGAAIESEVVQELLKLAAINPLKNLLTGSNSLPTLLSLVNGGQQAAQTAAAGSTGVSSGYGGGSLSAFSQIFSTQQSGGLGTLLFGKGAVGAAGPQIPTSGLFGAGGGSMADFFNSGFGTGLVGAGISAGSTIAAGGGSMQSLFAGGGSLIGGIAGSYFGPLGSAAGSAIGGLLGNLLGGLFGGKKKKPPKLKSITDIGVDESGLFGVGNTFTSHIGDATSKLGQNAAGGLNQFLASIGGSVNGPLAGKNELLYYGRTPRYMSTVGGATNQFGSDQQGAQDAISDFIARAMIAAVQQGKLTGVSSAVATAIKNSGATDVDALQSAVAFGQFFDRIDQVRDPASAAAKALNDLNSQMAASVQQAQQYGLEASKIPEIYAANFNDQVQDAILQISDPSGYALKQLDLQKAADIAQAQKLGADINAVEQEYALKRQQIVAQGLASVSDSFQQFFNSLLTGDLSALSPQDQLSQAQSAYDAAKAGGSADDFTSAAQTLLQVASDFYASTKGYADIYKQVLTDTKALGNLNTPLPAFAKGGWHGGGLRVVGEQGPEIEATGAARYWDAKTTAQMLQSQGAANDNHLVHVNDSEFSALLGMGGSGTINPRTGLYQFEGGGLQGGSNNGNKIGAAHDDTKSGNGGGGNGGSNGNGTAKYNDHGQLIGGANNSSFGKQVTKTGASAAAANSPGAQNAAKGKSGSGGGGQTMGNSTTADETMAKKYNVDPATYDKAVRAYAGRIDDYNDRGNSFGDNFGNFLASMAGVTEMNPTFDPTNLNPNADWGFDPVGAIAGAIGMAFGIPGLGVIAGGLSSLLGHPLGQINLGPSVFGSPDDATSSQAQSLAASNDNLAGGVNNGLNEARAAGLSAAMQNSLGGASLSPSSDMSPATKSLAAATKTNSDNIAALHSALAAMDRTNKEMLNELTQIRQSQASLANWQKTTGSRQKVA